VLKIGQIENKIIKHPFLCGENKTIAPDKELAKCIFLY
jgi:hypothetical protein